MHFFLPFLFCYMHYTIKINDESKWDWVLRLDTGHWTVLCKYIFFPSIIHPSFFLFFPWAILFKIQISHTKHIFSYRKIFSSNPQKQFKNVALWEKMSIVYPSLISVYNKWSLLYFGAISIQKCLPTANCFPLPQNTSTAEHSLIKLSNSPNKLQSLDRPYFEIEFSRIIRTSGEFLLYEFEIVYWYF